MGSLNFFVDRISFEGALTRQEINQIVEMGPVPKLQTAQGWGRIPVDVPTLQKLNDKYFRKFPETMFRTYHDFSEFDLSPLAVLTDLQKLCIETDGTFLNIETIYSLDKIRHLYVQANRLPGDFLANIPDSIETLDINVANQSFDLKNLSRLKNLKILSLHKCRKNIEVISELKELHCLRLHGISLPSYSFMNELPKLNVLTLSRGNIEDLSELYGNDTIEGLYMFHLLKLNNLEILAKLPNLQAAEICQLTHVEKLPDLSESNLQELVFEDMRSLLDFTALRSAPHLKYVSETVCPASLEAEHLLPVLQNPNITGCSFCTSSSRKNDLFNRLAEEYNKKWNRNDEGRIREILFPDGMM